MIISFHVLHVCFCRSKCIFFMLNFILKYVVNFDFMCISDKDREMEKNYGICCKYMIQTEFQII